MKNINTRVPISFPPDAKGFTGRRCPNAGCERYFKIKFGTGLPGSDHTCPYCQQHGTFKDFMTQEQEEYAQSYVAKAVLGPALAELQKSFKALERSSSRFIKIKVSGTSHTFKLSHYQELELETHVTCDSCGLEFAIYGVFAVCPDCSRLNALTIFLKSMEVIKKQLFLIDGVSEEELKESILKDCVASAVSAFDGFGKALREHYPSVLPDKPRNLFQNLKALSDAFADGLSMPLADLIGSTEYGVLNTLFQVRHLYEHNMGVVDESFVKNIPCASDLLGRKYILNRADVNVFLIILAESGQKIDAKLKQRCA